MDPTERNIAIIGIIAIVVLGFYSYSPDLEYYSFNPPSEISYTSNDYFNFHVHNYGEKSGSYKLEASSENLLLKIGQFSSRGYLYDDSINKYIEDEDDDIWNIRIKSNKSDLLPNTSLEFSYIDTSPMIFSKKHTWNFSYELEDPRIDQTYNYINEKTTYNRYIVFGELELNY
jgi:hypothetical protein